MTGTTRQYFDAQYASSPDPWGFESSPYEQRKYGLTMASLPAPRYRSAFEPGCSIGVLSAQLATRCDRLLATDIVPAAVARAARRCRGASHVHCEVRSVPDQWPTGPFDLVVLSEIAYYFDRPTLSQLMDRLLDSTSAGATLVAVHWRGPTDYPLTGDEAHRMLGSSPAFTRRVHHVEDEFVLDVWQRSR